GLLVVDRDRGGEPLHRLQRCVVSRAARRIPVDRARGGDRCFPRPGPLLAERRAVGLSWRPRAARRGADSRSRPRGERRPALARPAVRRHPTLGTDEARRGALRGGLHGAQARGDEELQARPAADARGDAAGQLAAAARARFRRAGGDRRHGVLHALPRRHEWPPLPRAGRHARRRLRAARRLLAVPDAAHLRLHGSLVRSVRQGLPALARADRVRPRRMARRRPRRERREAALPARGAYRLPARGGRRRARLRRHCPGDHALRLDRRARLRHRPSGLPARSPLRRARRAGHRRLDRLPGAHQHGREHGAAADQGPHAAADELWRLGAAGELCRARDPAQDRLGEPPARARTPRLMPNTILIMAGGTGGHIFPGLAVAAEMRAAGWDVVWMGGRGGMEEGLLQKLLLPANLLYAFWESARHIRRIQPSVVLGLGGYVAFPGGMMASLLNKPLALHEQNAIAGLTNKVLSIVCDKVMQAFPETLKGAEWTGNPVRAGISSLALPEKRFQDRTGPLRVLVVGGSLGAQALNEVLPKAIALLPE